MDQAVDAIFAIKPEGREADRRQQARHPRAGERMNWLRQPLRWAIFLGGSIFLALVYGDGVDSVVRVETAGLPPVPPERSTLVDVNIDAALAGVSGSLGLRAPFSATIALEDSIACTGAHTDARARGQIPVTLHAPHSRRWHDSPLVL
jgi:hypothetical protein